MVSFSSCWILLIGSKKLGLCSHNWISRNIFIAASPKVSGSNISFVTFLFGTTLVDIHISGRGLKRSMNVVSSIPKTLSTHLQHLDLSLFLTYSSQDVYNCGHRNWNVYKNLLEYLLYMQHLSPPFNNVNICRELAQPLINRLFYVLHYWRYKRSILFIT